MKNLLKNIAGQCRVPFVAACWAVVMCGGAALVAQDRLDSSPPGWRGHGTGRVQGGALKVNPVSATPVVNRRLSFAAAEASASQVATPQLDGGGVVAFSTTAQSDADFQTAELLALAAGLKNDRDVIFSWVRDNIRYVHYHGCKKGAHLTYLERSGNDIDQSALLVALWRAANTNTGGTANIDCQYVFGLIEMPETAPNNIDWYHYLGVNPSELFQLVGTRGTPDGNFGVRPGQPATTKALKRAWVQAKIVGTNLWIDFDPSFKLIEPEVQNLDPATVMGYDRTSLLNSLGAGTAGVNSITGLNAAALETYLGARVTQFLANFRTSYSGNTVGETIGGWKPLYDQTVADSSFPITAAGYYAGTYVGQTYDILPASLYTTISLQSSTGISWSGTMASLRGRRLGMVFENFLAKLKLDDDLPFASATTAIVAGTAFTLQVDIVQAESTLVVPGVSVNGNSTLACKGDGTYALIYGFDVTPEYVKSRREQLDLYKQQGLQDTDVSMRLETLNVIGLEWLLQTEMSHTLYGALRNQSPTFLFRFGRTAQEIATGANTTLYIDVPLNHSGFVSRVPDPSFPNRIAAELAYAFTASAMEHGVLEQTQPDIGNNAISTAKMVKLANGVGTQIFLGNQANWTAIQPALSAAYTPNDLSQLNQAVSDGGEVFLPQTGGTLGHWSGTAFAYSVFTATQGRNGMIIGGLYSGGYSGAFTFAQNDPITIPGYAAPIRFDPIPATHSLTLGGDPVDLVTGHLTHSRELLTAGNGLVRGLGLSVSYHGARRFKNESRLGYGWTHSYNVKAIERVDLEGAFGKTSPVEMATSLVGAVIALDLFEKRGLDASGTATTSVPLKAKNWVATALVANWMVDQLKGSGVSVISGDRIWPFHKQGDGSYSAPPGAKVTLIKNGLGRYELTERNGPTWRFDASNRLFEIEDLWGKKLTLAYNGTGDVTTVQDAFARTLTFVYGGVNGSLSSVTDNSAPARSATFSVNASADLTSLADPEGKSDNFTYLSGHRPQTYTNHNGSTVATSFYDNSARVITQHTMGDAAKVWNFYYAPGQTVEREPAGTGTAETTHFFDERNRETKVINGLGHELRTYYDGQDRVTARERLVSNGLGGWAVDDVEYFGYDTDHNLVWTQDPKGYFTFNTYDTANRLTSVQDKRGNLQFFQNFNTQHQPTQVTDRENRVVTMTYKLSTDPGAGQVATTTEGGFTTTYQYDARGALASVTYPGGAGESRVNNLLGDPITVTDPLSRQTAITYNKRREVATTIAPGTVSSGTRMTKTSYDNARNLASVENPRNFTTNYLYSATRKLLTTTLPDGAVSTSHYNAREQVDWMSNPLGQTVTLGLDALGRPTGVTDPLSRTSTTLYEDALRRTTSQSPAPLNIQTKVTVDEIGQVVANQNGLGQTAVPEYDENGNQTKWTDRRAKAWLSTYDKEDRVVTAKSPLLRTTTSGYNARGLLGTVTEPSGQLTTLGYDGRRRLTSRVDGVGTIGYTLNNASEVTAVTQGAAVLGRTYHAGGQVATYTNANNETISYDYDQNGNLVSLTYPAIGAVPALTVTYTYDNRDRLSTVNEGGRTTTYTWDAAGRLTQVTRANGTKRVRRFDAAGQTLALEERPAAGAPLALRSFGYDSAGRISKRLSYPQGSAWVEPAWVAAYDDDNRLVTLAGAALSYDLDGNLLGSRLPDGPWGASGSSSGASGTFTWNARNQLTQVARSNGGQVINYVYDAEGNLVSQTDNVSGTTRWVMDGARVLAMVVPGGAVTRYIYGAGLLYAIRPDGSVRHYHYDQLGSTIALSDAAGAVVGRADYTPYGAVQGASGELAVPGATPFLFVGAHGVRTDRATGLHAMGARWYSSHLRRFMSEDPIGFAGGENFYGYAAGNPIGMIDPSGLRPGAADYRGISMIDINGIMPSLLGPPAGATVRYADGSSKFYSAQGDVQQIANYVADVFEHPGDHKLDIVTAAAPFAGRAAGMAINGIVSRFVAGPAAKTPLAPVLGGHGAGQGFTGVFDSATGKILIKPSTAEAAIPQGWVPRAGGHADVSAALGGNTAGHSGFAVILQENGSLNIAWRSGTLNRTPGSLVPEGQRQAIIDAVKAATGRTVNH